MTLITIKLSVKELELLTSLASDQMFRREFIESRLPGYRINAGDISLGKVLVARLESVLGTKSVKGPTATLKRRS